MPVPKEIDNIISNKIKTLEREECKPRYLIISKNYEKYFEMSIENSKTLWQYAKFKIPVRYKNLEILFTDKKNVIEVY